MYLASIMKEGAHFAHEPGANAFFKGPWSRGSPVGRVSSNPSSLLNPNISGTLLAKSPFTWAWIGLDEKNASFPWLESSVGAKLDGFVYGLQMCAMCIYHELPVPEVGFKVTHFPNVHSSTLFLSNILSIISAAVFVLRHSIELHPSRSAYDL